MKRFLTFIVLCLILTSCASHGGGHTNARNPFRFEELCYYNAQIEVVDECGITDTICVNTFYPQFQLQEYEFGVTRLIDGDYNTVAFNIRRYSVVSLTKLEAI